MTINKQIEKNLLLRIGTAIVGVPIVLAMVIFSKDSFLLFCAVLSIAGIWELIKLSGHQKPLSAVGFALLPGITLWLSLLICSPHPEKIQDWLFITCLALFLVNALSMLFHKNIKDSFYRLSIYSLGGIYILSPFVLLYRLGFSFTGNFIFYVPLGILLLVWCSDTMAYVAGRLTGKHKLMPSVSPSKTWEGAIGGFLCTLMLAWFLEYTWTQALFNWWEAGLIIGIFCPLGDLIESRIKRTLKIKDSGGLLPGHGGILDRFDGFLFSVPALYLWLSFNERLVFWFP